MARPLRALTLMALGGAAAALADPVSGRRRRHMLRDRTMAAVRRSERRARARMDYAVGEMRGTVHNARPRRDSPPDDDRTLADRVKSEAFRGMPITPHEANVGVVDGIVTLRGRLASRTIIDELVLRVGAVPGVRSVENLLHTAEDAPAAAGRA
jgi:hyperosmotically inducible periplasmic protein